MTFGTMHLCPFVKVLVGGLDMRILVASKPTREGIHSLRFPFLYDIKIQKKFGSYSGSSTHIR